MGKELIILGTGGSAYDVLDIIDAINRCAAAPVWRVAGFLDDARAPGTHHLDWTVLGQIGDAPRFADGHYFINTIGSDRSFQDRPQIVARTQLEPARFATLIHPSASVSSRA